MERAELLVALANFPARLGGAAGIASARPTPDGEWTPEEVIRHLIAVEVEVHQARFQDLEGEGTPHWSWAEPGPWPGEPELTLAQLVERFAHLRAETLATVDAWDEAAWSRSGVHATYGPMDVARLLQNMLDHDAEHLRGLR